MAKLFYFSDIHCYLFPTNYINADDTHTGLFEIAKKIEPDSLVLDGGDNLQGSLLARHVILNKIRPLPQALAFKAAKLAGFTLGNHDFNYGREVIEDLASELNLPLLNANLKDDLNRLKPKQYQVYTM
ncbi:MAG: bifunctional metallophosphatase/5'-nucleotidase, partial [Spirochaetales bacterium]|nr:bifunctional metallophosphatase/5'-nucleotidase [Spirochaetales bacterium]